MKQYKFYKDRLRNNRDKIYILHYACSDINKPEIEISSICTYKLESHAPPKQFSRVDDQNEKYMLKKFWDFITEVNPVIVGWNINKPNVYGIEVLQKRYNQLCESEKITKLPEAYDLDLLLKSEYNLPRYDNHPKLYYYADINGCTLLNFRKGVDELELLRQKEFKAIDMSVQRKCTIISDLVEFYLEGKLKLADSKRICEQKLLLFGLKQSGRFFWIWLKSKIGLYS